MNSSWRSGSRPYPVPEVLGSEQAVKYPVSRCGLNGNGHERANQGLLPRELFSHQSMQQIDPLQRAHHHLEMRDLAVIAEGDDVDAVNLDALDLVFEFEDRAIRAAPFAGIFEAGPAKHLLRARQIFEGDVAPALRRVNDGAFEHRIRVQQVPQRRRVMGLHVAVPLVEAAHGHHVSPLTGSLAGDDGLAPGSAPPALCTLTHMQLYA